MSAIIHEYELSIWKDVWSHPTILDEDGSVAALLEGEDVLNEEKSAILSTDEMDFSGKAINITFKVKNNGTHELTFDLPSKYIDPNTGKKVHNYLRDYIDNETKVKLHYCNKWYSFHVKKVVEKREKNYVLFNYTCEDSFITELSKTGYKLTFNEYTEHYIEQIHTFANAITEGSEWSYDQEATEENCDLIEYQEEKLVEYVTTSPITVSPLVSTEFKNNDRSHLLYQTNGTRITIPSGTIVYGFYSELKRNIVDTYGHGNSSRTELENIKQIIYVPENEEDPGSEYELSGKTIINKNCNYIVKTSQISNARWEEDNKTPQEPHFHRKGYYGLKIVYNQYTEFCKPLDRYVKRYYRSKGSSTLSDLYSYTKTHVMVPEIATNYAANGKDMVDTTGWAPFLATDKLSVERISGENHLIGYETNEKGVKIPKINLDDLTATPATYGIAASDFHGNSSNSTSVQAKIVNTGPFSRKLVIDSPTTFALKLSYKWVDIDDTDYLSANNETIQVSQDVNSFNQTRPTVYICQPLVNDLQDSYYKDIVTESSALDDDGNYNFGDPLITLSNVTSDQYYLLNFSNTMLEGGSLKDLFIVIEFNTGLNKKNVFCIEKLEFFEAWTHTGKHTKPKGGWNGPIGVLAPGTDGQGNSILDYYVVPQWRSSTDTDYLTALQNWDNRSGSISVEINSAAGLYDKIMEIYNTWKTSIEQEHATDYTLVTSESIVTGESFEEELYFTLPSSQPLFADPYVLYCNPTENSSLGGYNIEQWYNNCKYRTLKQEKSNRFNLTQELSKLFKVYPVYDIKYYDNGVIKKKLYDEDNNEVTINNYDSYILGAPNAKKIKYSLRDKRLYYTDHKGGENKYGFKYGHNLNSVSRTIDSTDVITKMFVADNTSDYAKDGICTIARAVDNIGKDTYLLNFSYFIDRKKISRERVERDVYSTERIAIKKWEDTLNLIERNPDNTLFKDLRPGYYKDENNVDYIPSIIIYRGLLPTLGAINSRYDYISEEQAKLEKYQLIVLEASVQTYTSALKSLREQLAKQKQLFSSYVLENTSKKAVEYAQSVERIASRIVLYEWQLEAAKYLYEIYADLYNRYECEQRHLLYWKKEVEDNFNIRYESLIKEGYWQDSKYLEDNSYYLDAEKVLVDSCGPKITYNISVTDLSVLQKYKFTDFNIGDTTYVEDYEFFEDDPNTNDKYYQEKTIVSAITYNLDNPSKNTISLQNYTTKFDDLFSRITASVQSLTFNENIYQRAGKFTTDGQIDVTTLQDTLEKNKVTIVGNQDVLIDSNGIVVTDLRIPSNKIKIEGCGVFVTSDGGNSWKSAIGEGGVNAELLTIGSINTQKITIFNEKYSNFVWDKEGLTAYGSAQQQVDEGTKEVTTNDTYVRFNQYGLFFTKDNSNFENGLTTALTNASSELDESVTDYIMNNANVAITYNGFSINGGKEGKVRLNSIDGLILSSDKRMEVKVGYIDHIADIKPFWGLYAHGAYIEGKLYSDSSTKRLVQFGSTVAVNVLDTNRAIIANGSFCIYKTIVRLEGDSAVIPELKYIASIGPSLMKSKNQNLSIEQQSEEEIYASTDTQLGYVGCMTHLEQDGKFWAIATKQETGGFKPRVIYAKESFPAGAEGDNVKLQSDTFYFLCSYGGYSQPETSSDIKFKKNIIDLDDRYIKLFDELKVKKFQLKNKDEKYHLGFIAQDIEISVNKYVKDDNLALVGEGFNGKSLIYPEILSLCVLKIKQLEKEIEELKKTRL